MADPFSVEQDLGRLLQAGRFDPPALFAERGDIAEGRELGDVTTLRDPTVMMQLRSAMTGTHHT